ncbi:hypothetical protein [Rhizobium freirei]|uniref:hypothetical protein n=1 Tax=Rhizobium freirei TaxID=1353277 RepID=UPI0003A48EB7|nr:hypothetical protein [Rhizobium freirei]
MQKTPDEDPPEIKIIVRKDGKKPIYEFRIGNLSYGKVPAQWIVEAIRELAGALRWEQ